jgi:DNA-directed RNA polymerase subunit RPC12/RpoP
MSFVPCTLCGSKLEKRTSKNNKPYFVCDPCGIQLFVRRKEGIERLDALMRAAKKNLIPFEQHAHRLFEVQAILEDIQGTKSQIEKLERENGIFFPDQDKTRACNSLKTRLETLHEELEKLAEKSTR